MDKSDKTQKKPSKQPIIRQTKTSIYRLAKANPLLIKNKQITVGDKDVKLPLAVTYHRRLTLDDIEFNKWMQSKAAERGKQSFRTLNCSKENIASEPPTKSVTGAPKKKIPLTKSKTILPNEVLEIQAKPSQQNASQDNFKKPLATAPKAGKLRRSISSEHFAHSKQASVSTSNVNIKKTPSEQNLFTDLNQTDPFSNFIGCRSTPLPTKIRQLKSM